jgi:tRNA A-37 threonylcarbamoyl transferase component Bud32
VKRAELGEPIARGGVSELFALPDGRVLKLFRRGFGAGFARDEAAITARLHALGLRVPVVGAPVEVEGRFGFPMQRIDGVLLAESVLADPASAASAARTAAELHVAMHALSDATLPALRSRFESIIGSSKQLPPDALRQVLDVLHELPEHDQVCHGDFHAGNILMTSSGPFVIDCATAHRGNPRVDAAQTFVAMTEWLASPQPESARAALRVFIECYESEYFALRPEGRDEFERAKPVVAAVRLALPHPATSDELLRRIAQGKAAIAAS